MRLYIRQLRLEVILNRYQVLYLILKCLIWRRRLLMPTMLRLSVLTCLCEDGRLAQLNLVIRLQHLVIAIVAMVSKRYSLRRRMNRIVLAPIYASDKLLLRRIRLKVPLLTLYLLWLPLLRLLQSLFDLRFHLAQLRLERRFLGLAEDSIQHAILEVVSSPRLRLRLLNVGCTYLKDGGAVAGLLLDLLTGVVVQVLPAELGFHGTSTVWPLRLVLE